jgi:TonB family protein
MTRAALPSLLTLLLLASACESEPAPADAGESRAAIAIAYVRGGELPIHARPSDDSPVIATYSRGQSVSVLSYRGEWEEVRVADRSGWARAASLADAAEAKAAEADNGTAKFRVPPAPVTSPGAHGEITLEASVNQDGEVIDVRTLQSTTGNPELVLRNRNALRAARFEPIVQHGQRKAFTYEYRVHY